MKILNKILAGALAVASLSSCSDEFLETAPTAQTSPATVFSNVDNVKMAVNGLAYLMCTQHAAFSQGYCGENRIISIYNEYPSQEFRYNQMAAGWEPIMDGLYYSRKATTYCSYPWSYYYAIIADANTIIASVDGAEGSESEKAFYKAQALTFRAYSYVKLLELFSVRWQDSNNGAADGVVLRLEPSVCPMALSSMAECYDQIYADLEDAISLFNESGLDRDKTSVWLTNINVAYGVYARAALHKQDYSKALEMSKLAQKGFPLMSNEELAAGFAKPTSEWIFGSYASADENNWYYTFGTQFGCNGYYASKSKYGAGDIEKELTDRMPKNDARMGLFLTVDKIGIDSDEAYLAALENGDINSTYGYFESDEAWDKAYEYINSRTPAGFAPAYSFGYAYVGGQLKFWVFDTPGVSYICFMRTSEMVLIEAEANYFLGKEKDAQDALVKLNATSGRNPEYTCSLTGEKLFSEIVDYRELELWGEGFNWYDYKRWNKDVVRKSFDDGGNCHAATATTISASGSTWTWAIPEAETDHNNLIE